MQRIVYVDGIWDLFHMGHVKHLIELKNLDNDDNFLVVGIISDKDAEGYKRTPIYNQEHRKFLISSCKYVDKFIENAPLVLTKEFIAKHNIDIVCHGFSDINDITKQDEFFKVPKELGKFRAVKYNEGISTTQIIEKIQNRKKEKKYDNIIEEKVNENIILDITDKNR